MIYLFFSEIFDFFFAQQPINKQNGGKWGTNYNSYNDNS